MRVSMVSRKGYKIAHRISETQTGHPIYISESSVKLETLAFVIDAWSSLSFAYTKTNETAGTFWSEDSGAFINASMLFQCEGLHTVCVCMWCVCARVCGVCVRAHVYVRVYVCVSSLSLSPS